MLLFPAILALASNSHYCLLAAKSAHWSKLHFQNSSAHGDTTKGMLVKIIAFAGLLPPAAEFLESKFSSLSSPLFQQLGLGFHTCSPQPGESSETTVQKLSLLLSSSFVTAWGGLSLSLLVLIWAPHSPGLLWYTWGRPFAKKHFNSSAWP